MVVLARSSHPVATMATIDPPNIADVAPDFTVPDANEIRRNLAELCAERPIVLVFYRGHW